MRNKKTINIIISLLILNLDKYEIINNKINYIVICCRQS